MFKNLFKNRIKINIQGVNLKRLLKNIIKNDIEIYEFNQISYKNIEFYINSKKFKNLKPLLKDYRYDIVEYKGLSFFYRFSYLHLGIIIGLVVFFAVLFLNNNYLSKIVINGTNRIDNNNIIKFLNEKDIKTNSFFTNINVEKLETDLENNFTDISFVSVIKKGTNVIINIKEKLYADEILETKDIIASCDGQIVKIDLKQGTSKVKVGDSVKAGDVLVEGVITNGGISVNTKAIAEITMKVWYTDSFVFENETIEKVRTGKFIENSYYKLFNKTIVINNNEIPYKNYEIEQKEEYLFNNNILPIKIFKEKFYEILENVKKNDFSLQKDAIIEVVTRNAKNKVPTNIEIFNQTINISETDNGKVVTCYIETIQSFN